MIHYLPGCDVRNNHPEAMIKLTDYMRKKGAVIDRCCRVKEKLLREKDVIVNNCTLCNMVLNETHPDNECLSLYEYVLEDGEFPWADRKGEEITVQDCWRTRDNLRLQKAVRQCLRKMNYTVVETEDNYNKTKYCGVWLYNNPAKDCIETAPETFKHIMEHDTCLLPEDEQERRMKEWVLRYQTEQILVYCNGCERGIRLGGRRPAHLVELLAAKL